MTPERWQQVNQLFQSAVELVAGERQAFLDKICAGDAELRREVETMIALDEQAGDFLETPVMETVGSQGLDPLDGSLAGRPVGPYRLVQEIGRGGMGVVYQAERADGEVRKQVAIKLIKRGMDTDALLRRFRHERQILADLDHPHIARFLDAGTTEDGRSYFIMEYVEGLPVDIYCDTHRLSIDQRLSLFRAICSAVQYAHAHHIIHRDLKPSNILVTAEGVPKLLDFGIAKLLDAGAAVQTGEATTGVRPMTPEYASPEQVRGEAMTPASDIYSLGVLLYELLTGHRPYRLQSRTPQAIERIICGEEPEKPSTVIDRIEEIPAGDGTTRIMLTPGSVSETRDGSPAMLRRRLAGDLDNIVRMALRKEPERRYASVEQLSEDIRRYLEGQPVRARKDTIWYRSGKFLKRNATAVLAAALTAAVLGIVAVGAWLFMGRGQIESLAVLPFVNVNADPNTEYLSDGVTETLMNHLSQLPDLKVLSRSAVFRYKQKEQDPQAVGRTLGVQAVVTGRVSQRDDQLSIHVELVDVRSNRHLWGDTYTRTRFDLLTLQEEIARQISDRLRTRLSGEEKKRLAKRYTENIEAYQAYLKGRYYWDKRTPDGLQKAAEYFQQAIEMDTRYALAYAGLADVYAAFPYNRDTPPKEAFPKAKVAAVKALEIDEALAEAHTTLGLVRAAYEWDWSGADKEFRRALELNPNYATARQRYATYLSDTGRHAAAILQAKRSQEADPLSLAINVFAGRCYYHARQYDQAIAQYRKALELDPNFWVAHLFLGKAYEQKGMFEAAIAELQKAEGVTMEAFAAMGYVYAMLGKKAEAEKILDELRQRAKQTYVPSSHIAKIYAGQGETEQALAWLERAYQERDAWLLWLKVEPMWDNLHLDPRFAELIRRIGLPP